MAAAQCWEAGFPPEVAALCGDQTELQLALVEHKVPMPGKGFPSQCDVFALVHADGRDMAVAVEAKVAEPFGPTIGEWLGETPSLNKLERIDTIAGWLGLDAPDPTLRYQLFHRCAAAIVEARRFRRPVAGMIVHSFSQNFHWLPDFQAFAAALGLDLGADEAGDVALPDGLVLRLGWAKGDGIFLADLTGAGT